ncbi:DUF3304 domain-containing protein [Paraburkholderia sp. Ac-20340]|uniref:DUF3304 domain-containing protein n=1 Tax=Paraburkholderia sp. Ac-20340 TaxID=2703888 RepID=UPI0019817FB8|nr:DUF3304 domain-containing protein [Paraburkholderia sp. Ac-20340]MBN3851849.1 DUF3304 domain-containing protein [Paraburkholderia sp. Ac-20340]
MKLTTRYTCLTVLTAMALAASACSRGSTGGEPKSFGTSADSKWDDPNIDIITAGSYNYTDYDIYGVYLLPLNAKSLDDAASANGASATPQSYTQWEGGPGGQPSLAWDFRWKTPLKMKVWWQRVVDAKLYASSKNYDAYTQRESEPGTAWCEGEITITQPPLKDKTSGILLHFFPDGRVEGDMNFVIDRQPVKVDIARRNEQPKLSGRACLKEISNPLYGRKKPVHWN